jgi:ABC-2 type transport system permease protein
MKSALGYLALRSTRNRIARQVRRLRTPRYAIALLLGLAYLWAIGVRQRPSSGPIEGSPETFELLAAVGVTLAVLWTWIFGSERRALAFSRAEVTWLFPAPLTRTQLIRYKLLRGQFVVLFNVLLWTALLWGGWAAAAPWRRAAAIWVLLTTLSLHRLGVALLRGSLREHGTTGLRARALTLTLAGVVAALALREVAQALPSLRAAWDVGLGEFFAAAQEATLRPVLRALLLPARLLVRPLLVEEGSLWGAAMVPALGILIAHYVWVVRSDAAFEETAAAAALARYRPDRPATRRPRFTARRVPPLAPTGWPAGALLWKNLVSVLRAGRVRSMAAALGVAALAIFALSMTGGSGTLLEIVGWLCAMWAGFLFVLGPQWIRNDLRTDLGRLGLLRSYPLRGAAVVAAETAGSTAVLSGLQLGLLGVAYLAFWGGEVPDPPPELRATILAGAVVLLPAVNFLGMLIQNGAAILLPGWVNPGPDRPLGVEALGHNMLIMSGFLLILAGLLVLPAAAGTAVLLGLVRGSGWWVTVLAVLAALLVMALEARVLLGRLGRIFEATDPASVAPAEVL